MYLPEVAWRHYARRDSSTQISVIGDVVVDIAQLNWYETDWTTPLYHPFFNRLLGSGGESILSGVVLEHLPLILEQGTILLDVDNNPITLEADYHIYAGLLEDDKGGIQISITTQGAYLKGYSGTYLRQDVYEATVAGGFESEYYHEVTDLLPPNYADDGARWQGDRNADNWDSLGPEKLARVDPFHNQHWSTVCTYGYSGLVISPPFGLFYQPTDPDVYDYITMGSDLGYGVGFENYETITEIENKAPELALFEAMEGMGLEPRYYTEGGQNVIQLMLCSRYDNDSGSNFLPLKKKGKHGCLGSTSLLGLIAAKYLDKLKHKGA